MESRIKDLYYAAALATLGFELVRIERAGRQVYWVFEADQAEFDEAQKGWTLDTIEVSAVRLSEAIRRFKSSVHADAGDPSPNVSKRRKP